MPRAFASSSSVATGWPLPGAQLLTVLLPFASLPGATARVSDDIDSTSLFIFTPVMYAAIDGALSVVCASFEKVLTRAVRASFSIVSCPDSPTL